MKTTFFLENVPMVGLFLVLLGIYLFIVIHTETVKNRACRLIPKLLTSQWITGRELRQELKRAGISLSYGSFYLVMSRLVEEGMVIYRDNPEEIDGEILKYRSFRLP